MDVLIAAEDGDGLTEVPIGRHQQAVSIDLSVEPGQVNVMGDARSVKADGVVTALVDPDENDGDGYWFFEVAEPFATPRRLANGSCLLITLAHVSADREGDSSVGEVKELPARARPTAIVLLAEGLDLYLVTKNTPLFSEPDWINWTNYTIPLDTSMPWRVADGPSEIVGGLERLPIDSHDRLATGSEIREALSSVQALRIRGGQPARAHMVLLRSLTVIQQLAESE